jgi:hypothetical protein
MSKIDSYRRASFERKMLKSCAEKTTLNLSKKIYKLNTREELLVLRENAKIHTALHSQ